MNDFGEKVVIFLAQLEGHCMHDTLDAVFAAASETDMPVFVLTATRDLHCSCQFLVNRKATLKRIYNACENVEDRDALWELLAAEYL